MPIENGSKMSTKPAAIVFRDNLRRLLSDRGLTQKEAADQIGIDYWWLRKICASGINKPQERTRERIEKIRLFFGIERTRLLWSPNLKTEPRTQVAKYSESELEHAVVELSWAFRFDPKFPAVRVALRAIRRAATKAAEKQSGESAEIVECSVCGERLSIDERTVGLCSSCIERTGFEKYAALRKQEKGDGRSVRKKSDG